MKTPRDIIAFVGTEQAAARLGVSVDRIDRATRDKLLPASWYDGLEALARRPLDRALFTFKTAEEGAKE